MTNSKEKLLAYMWLKHDLLNVFGEAEYFNSEVENVIYTWTNEMCDFVWDNLCDDNSYCPFCVVYQCEGCTYIDKCNNGRSTFEKCTKIINEFFLPEDEYEDREINWDDFCEYCIGEIKQYDELDNKIINEK